MAKKLDPEAAMDMTIEQIATHFGWSNRKVEDLLWWRDSANGERWENYSVEKTVTLRVFLRSQETRKWNVAWHDQALMIKLKEIGLTRLQSWIMPRGYVTFEMLTALPREELLKRDAGALDSMSEGALSSLRDDDAPRLMVGDLLMVPRDHYRLRNHSTTRTLALLERLGFGPDDGPFMAHENDPRYALAEELVVKEGLTADEAKKFAEIAARRNWI